MSVPNYFKVVGPGLGRPEHCFSFFSGGQEIAALAEASMISAVRPGSKIVAWKRCLMHPHIRVVGDVPETVPMWPEDT